MVQAEFYQDSLTLAIFSTVFKNALHIAIEQRMPAKPSRLPMIGLKAEANQPQMPNTIVGTSHSEEQWPKTWTSSSNFLEEEEEEKPLEEEKEDVA